MAQINSSPNRTDDDDDDDDDVVASSVTQALSQGTVSNENTMYDRVGLPFR